MVIKRLFPFIDMALIALALYVGVNGVYRYLSYRLEPQPTVTNVRKPVATSSQVSSRRPFSDYGVITQRNLFHTSSSGDKPKADIMLDSLEQTQLKLKLWGTVPIDDNNGYAVIEDETNRKEGQKLYSIGDSIKNAKLKMVLRNKVVLTRLGKDEVLEMEDLAVTTSSSSSTRSTVSSARTTTSSTTESTTATISRRRISLSRAQVDSAMGNLAELAGQINIQPHTEDGQADGFALSNIQPNSLFRRMGLRNGDILTAVDGQPLNSVEDAYRLYEDLKSSDSAQVEINRKGRPTVIEYRIR